MTNDYAALVAMLDQAAADLQAEIDAAIDRHGLLARTAAALREEADGPNVAAVTSRPAPRLTTALPGRARLHAVPRAAMTFTEPPDWHQHAACADPDPDLFFPGRGQPITDARRVCATCPVVSSPSGTGSHMAAHRRRTDGAA